MSKRPRATTTCSSGCAPTFPTSVNDLQLILTDRITESANDKPTGHFITVPDAPAAPDCNHQYVFALTGVEYVVYEYLDIAPPLPLFEPDTNIAALWQAPNQDEPPVIEPYPLFIGLQVRHYSHSGPSDGSRGQYAHCAWPKCQHYSGTN